MYVGHGGIIHSTCPNRTGTGAGKNVRDDACLI